MLFFKKNDYFSVIFWVEWSTNFYVSHTLWVYTLVYGLVQMCGLPDVVALIRLWKYLGYMKEYL